MSKSPIERIQSNLYDDLPPSIRRAATSPLIKSPSPLSSSPTPLKKIIVHPTSPPILYRTISDAAPRKAPSPPAVSPPTSSVIADRRGTPEPQSPLVTLSASLSQKRRTQKKETKETFKKEAMETFQFVQVPPSNTDQANVSKDEVDELKRKVALLESRLEELQDTVRVCLFLMELMKMLQRDSDPARQAALEDWAIEKMISVYNQFFPQPKSTIAELVRLFSASGYASSRQLTTDKRVY